MKVRRDQIFNLMDTNGRRNDVINALQGYLSILDNVQNEKKMKWASLPESLAQYNFYKQAIELSPEVFRRHGPYDNLLIKLRDNPDFFTAVENDDVDWIKKNLDLYGELIGLFDKGIEDRARHYTSNLVKLGFSDKERTISPIGELILDLKKLKKDRLEIMLPIDGVNIIYLRQLLKLRIFDENEEKYYSPFNLALFALLKKKRFSENDFLELVQGLSPYSRFNDIEDYIINYKAGNVVADIDIKIPDEIDKSSKIEKDVFTANFKNKKSSNAINIYWKYYNLLWEYIHDSNDCNLNKLLNYYENNKEMLNKAFGRGQNIFSQRVGERPCTKEFSEQYHEMLDQNINVYIYIQFILSKTLDQIREYSDTTKRIFKATGIISFDNGFVELAYRELCTCIFEEKIIKKHISGDITKESSSYYDCYGDYEDDVSSYFCDIISLSEIFEYYEDDIKQIEESIQKIFPKVNIKDIPSIIANRRKEEFAKFIESSYPENKVKEILRLFAGRNDNEIKEIVSQDATVPTIYEYMIGIAWYYFSGKRIDLLQSYNLTLSADFEPLVHAGGGKGDIIIYEDDKVVMLEATLMNANSQKRGEWEPVLRHSINLKINEETENTGRQVISFFIADRFDYNTINIWKAIASVPLQSSINRNKFTDNVIIMPVNTEELCLLMDKYNEYDEIISEIYGLFEPAKKDFDINWRKNFMEKII